MKLDELKYETYYNYEEVESRSNRVDGRSEAYDRLNALITASSQKRSPNSPRETKRKKEQREYERYFSAPRTGCNRDAVGALLGQKGSVDDSSGEGFSARYSKWKAVQESKGVTDAKLKSKEAFKKDNPLQKKVKVVSKMISEDEYYAYLGANQHLFVIQKPSRLYLNF